MPILSYIRPKADEYREYFAIYLAQLGPDESDVLALLREQGLAVLSGLKRLDDNQLTYRYEPGKWSVGEVIGHLIDTERLFAFRALWIARGAVLPQPGMDENAWAANSNAGGRSRKELWKEHHVTRTNHLYLLRSFDEAAIARRGEVEGNPLSVNAVPWLIAAHERHHLVVLRERYGVDMISGLIGDGNTSWCGNR